MAIYNREDYKTALPQLEKEFNRKADELKNEIPTDTSELTNGAGYVDAQFITTKSKSESIASIPANSVGYIDVDMSGVAPDGYTLVGVVQLVSTASSSVPVSWYAYDADTIRVYYRNITSSAVSQTTTVLGLYKKNS